MIWFYGRAQVDDPTTEISNLLKEIDARNGAIKSIDLNTAEFKIACAAEAIGVVVRHFPSADPSLMEFRRSS